MSGNARVTNRPAVQPTIGAEAAKDHAEPPNLEPRSGTVAAAIFSVLREAGKPLAAKEIHRLIVQAGYYSFKATDPLHVVRSQLRRHCEGLGFASARPSKYFARHGDGKYFLAQHRGSSGTPPTAPHDNGIEALQVAHERYLSSFASEVLRQIRQLSPSEFERFCARFLLKYGFERMEVTGRSADGGIDAHGILRMGISKFRVAVQCKRWKSKKVGRPEVNQFRGDIQGRFEQGIFLTTREFTKEAIEVQRQPGAVPLVLIDGPELVRQMVLVGFGIQRVDLPTYSIALDEVLEEVLDTDG